MITKYKFQETTGCTAFNYTVNGKSLSELSEQEYNEMRDYVFARIKDELTDHTILFEDVVRLFQYDHYESDLNPCEQCGDTVDTTIWNL